MTNQEAIKRIKEHIAIHKYRESHAIHIVEALEIAISVLEEREVKHLIESSSTQKALDTISRQDAIDEIRKCRFVVDAIEKIRGLPSAQPEIVRCKNCKYCEHWYADKGRCFLWHESGIDVFEDGFCNYAERRTNA